MSLNKAAADMKYLLDRGYPRSTALNLVVNHYGLSVGQRNFLVRYVFSDDEIRDHRSRLIPVKEIMGEDVVVDTFNVLITVEVVLTGGEIVEGMDGFLRDTSAVFSKYRFSETSRKALNKILEVLSRHKPASVLFILDSQISRSGELASLIRKQLKDFSLEGDARTSGRADYEIIKSNQITCSSDSVIIGKVGKVVDLGKAVLSSGACP